MEFLVKLCTLLPFLLWAVSGEDNPMEIGPGHRNTSLDEGESLEEEWVREAMLDLAYYVRSHKFNEFDRRYQTLETGKPEYFAKFPTPPLRSFHWEVSKYCSQGLMQCLRYTMEFIGQVKLNRAIDSVYLMRNNNWTWASNQFEIERAEHECRQFYKEDFQVASPFDGPLQRFQWRTTVAYFMCSYTMEKAPSLSVFGEPCDNFANCMWANKIVSTGDPRADDSKPFACARYSFCPDPCCPVKQIKSLDECFKLKENPCPKDSKNRTCIVNGTLNLDVHGLSKNQWNLTCSCNEEGFIYDPRFRICVDVDECLINSDNCNNTSELCLNSRGSYLCACRFTYKWNEENKTCQPMKKLQENLDRLDFMTWDKINKSLSALDSEFAGAQENKPTVLSLVLFLCAIVIIACIHY